MKQQLLFCALVGTIMACQREKDIQPTSSTLAGEVVGIYRTNAYVDPSRVATPAEQMPSIELKVESDSNVTLVYSTLDVPKTSQSIQHIRLIRQADGIQLRLADSSIGTLQTDRVFTNSGMEKQGKLLRITIQNDGQNLLNFAGFK